MDAVLAADTNVNQAHGFECVPKFDACSLGQLFNVVTEECEPCPINTYADSALEAVDFGRRIMCTPCPDEFQQAPTGSISQLSCKYKFRSLNSSVAMSSGFCTGADYDKETAEMLQFTSISSSSDCKNYADTKGYSFAPDYPECEDAADDAAQSCTAEVCVDARAKLRGNIAEIGILAITGEYLPASLACKLTCEFCDPKWKDLVGSEGRLAPPSGCVLEGAANSSNTSKVRYYDSEASRRFLGSTYLPVCEVFRCDGTFEEVVSEATRDALPVCDLGKLFADHHGALESDDYRTFYIALGSSLLVLAVGVYACRTECCCRQGSTKNVLNCKVNSRTEDDDPSCCCLKCTDGVPWKVHRMVWLGFVARLADMATDWAFLWINIEGELFKESADEFWLDATAYTRAAWVVCIVGTVLTPLDVLSKAPSLRREAETAEDAFTFRWKTGVEAADGFGLLCCRLGRRAATIIGLLVIFAEDVPQLFITTTFAKHMTFNGVNQDIDVGSLSLTALNILISLISLGFNVYLVVTGFYYWKSEKELQIWYRTEADNLIRGGVSNWDDAMKKYKIALQHRRTVFERKQDEDAVNRIRMLQRNIENVPRNTEEVGAKKKLYQDEFILGDVIYKALRERSAENTLNVANGGDHEGVADDFTNIAGLLNAGVVGAVGAEQKSVNGVAATAAGAGAGASNTQRMGTTGFNLVAETRFAGSDNPQRHRWGEGPDGPQESPSRSLVVVWGSAFNESSSDFIRGSTTPRRMVVPGETERETLAKQFARGDSDEMNENDDLFGGGAENVPTGSRQSSFAEVDEMENQLHDPLGYGLERGSSAESRIASVIQRTPSVEPRLSKAVSHFIPSSPTASVELVDSKDTFTNIKQLDGNGNSDPAAAHVNGAGNVGGRLTARRANRRKESNQPPTQPGIKSSLTFFTAANASAWAARARTRRKSCV